jgi:anionic cell wall polymer biosynthesis LytR-Cps2A-Psr (LCP) family protein
MDYRDKKGMNHLNGKQALGFAREREAFADGDVQRVKNQQKVIDAIVSKVASSKTLLLSYTDILEAISTSFSTNLDRSSISRLVKMQLNDMRGWDSESQNLVGYSSMSKNCYSMKNMELYVMKQNPDSVKKNSDRIKEFMKIKENTQEQQ